ncbi:MAG: mechanosensitive ion channel [Salinivirgaceae bacterium]|jgi:small-conductance mechanosensitive channel|nr:mechanosensitive ion channel [Salinivirgaceae bacterium]
MSTVKEFLNLLVLEIDNYNLHLKQVLLALLIIIVAVFLFAWIKRYLKKGKLLSRLSIKNTKTLVRFIRLLIIILTVDLLINILGFDARSILQFELIPSEKVSITLFNLIILLVIFFITKLVLYLLELMFEDNAKKKNLEMGKSQSLFQIVKYIVWVIAITFFIDSLGFSITILIASMSALLVGLGLGIQNFFNDIVSGIVILFDHSIKVGDIVEIQEGVVGKVEEIQLRTSKVISRDDVVIIVPNSKFTGDYVINWSHNSFKTRFGVNVGVAYGSDVEKVKMILIEAAKEQADIDNSTEPIVYFRNFGDSSLDFELLFMTDESFRVERIKSDLRFAINRKFIENGVTIPFPQRDVHFYKKKE